jgi:hypothetical protein
MDSRVSKIHTWSEMALNEWARRAQMKPSSRVRLWRQCEFCSMTLGPDGPVYDPRVPEALFCECCITTRQGMSAREIAAVVLGKRGDHG